MPQYFGMEPSGAEPGFPERGNWVARDENVEVPAAKADIADRGPPKGTAESGWKVDYITREVLLGITICFAQIPESIAFAYMANIKPSIALHAAWMVGIICSVFGGRPGMVNGATGAFAAIIGTFIPSAGTGNNGEGVELLFPSVMFAGFLMLLVSFFKLSRFITLLPSPVMIGFCNGLAIVIGLAQIHPFKDAETHEFKKGAEVVWMLVICFSSMFIMEFLPKIPLKMFKVVPSSLLAIVSAILIEFVVVRNLGSRTNTIRDVSEFTMDTAFPTPFFLKTNAVNYDLDPIVTGEGLKKIVVQGLLLCIVGSIESLMTAEVVESFTKTPGDGDRTVLAMGFANLLSGFMGGMGGNAMIGLSTVNCLNGGSGRLGPAVTAIGIMVCVMGAYPLLNYIPVAALSGIMLVVVLHTFKWFSVKMVLAAALPQKYRNKFGLKHKVPRIEVLVIVVVTVLCKWPEGTNIAYAVGVGLAITALAFAWESGKKFDVGISEDEDNGIKYYDIQGPLFFASSNIFLKIMNPDRDPDKVEVRFASGSGLMDFSALDALNKLTISYKAKGKQIVFTRLSPESTKIIRKANSICQQIEYSENRNITKIAYSDPLDAVIYGKIGVDQSANGTPVEAGPFESNPDPSYEIEAPPNSQSQPPSWEDADAENGQQKYDAQKPAGNNYYGCFGLSVPRNVFSNS